MDLLGILLEVVAIIEISAQIIFANDQIISVPVLGVSC